MENTNHQFMNEQDLSVSATEIVNVIKRRNILNVSIQNKCIDMVIVHVFVVKRRHPNYLAHLEIYNNKTFEEIESLSNITQKLVMEHSEEILKVKCLEYSSPSLAR